jgi:ribonuclease Z
MKKFIKNAAAFGITAVMSGLMAMSVARAEELMTVTLLGTGTPRPTPDRNGTSTLIEVAGQRLMFDMGRGNTVSLFRARIPLGSITAHFITHMHSDHVNGLPDLYLTGWGGAPYGGRKKAFLVYGPKGTKNMMYHLHQAFSEDFRIRNADEGLSLDAAKPEAHDIEAGVVYEKDGVIVTAFAVPHGEKIQPAYGYKIEYKGRKVVLSGDTRYSKEVEEQGTAADLLIHEVATLGSDSEKFLAANPIYRRILDHHISPEQAGRLFSKARPKLAVYSHIALPPTSLADPSGEIIKQTRTTYGGPLVVGEDMMRFRIGAEGISIEKLP